MSDRLQTRAVVTKDPFLEFISTRRAEIEDWISRHITGREDRALFHRVLMEGKRLRPLLLLLVFEALGGTKRESALDVAMSLELAHNASLIHDDVIDMDLYRRGKPALWRQVGIGRAVIEGHRIINLAYKIVLEKGVEVARVFLDAWDKASFGVFEEVLTKSSSLNELYLKIAAEKTGYLFAAAAEVASILAETDQTTRASMKRYGLLVGTLYQLADDCVEIRRGGGLLRVILKIQQIEDIVRKAYIALKVGRFRSAMSSIVQLNSLSVFIKENMTRILNEIDELIDSIDVRHEYRDMLKRYPRYCVNEMLEEAKLKRR
ncbi:MAG: polyprenyl synthetase family protein [Aigarchaeota archaeon]|nr:polyprenyl synthetase family protein [Aigarchaeota archaeon]MDW8092678.1 polyprenyl synthetase family protein [Nitrososphaerota archaeon]